MKNKQACIEAICRHFVCKECRTKVGWPHQRWCSGVDRMRCACADCLYYNEKRGMCVHPILKREEWNGREKIEYPV